MQLLCNIIFTFQWWGFCSVLGELVTVASASLILSSADVPASLTNHMGLSSGTLLSPIHIRRTHVPWRWTQVFSLCNGRCWGGWVTLGVSVNPEYFKWKEGIACNVHLIKLWCIPLSFPQSCLCFISVEWICTFFCLIFCFKRPHLQAARGLL